MVYQSPTQSYFYQKDIIDGDILYLEDHPTDHHWAQCFWGQSHEKKIKDNPHFGDLRSPGLLSWMTLQVQVISAKAHWDMTAIIGYSKN